MKLPVLKAKRVVVRSVRAADVEAMGLLCGDYDVVKMLSRVAHPYDFEAGRSYLAQMEVAALNWREAEEIAFAIDYDGALIGGLSLSRLHHMPVIGYWLGKPFWGLGFMTEAVRVVLSWLFLATDYEMVMATAMTENLGSQAVLKKNGFKLAGYGEGMSLARGAKVPDVHMKLTRADFEQMTTA